MKQKESLIDIFGSHKVKAKADLNVKNNNKSKKWFNQKVKDLKFKQSSKPKKGSMITFVYDAKGKHQLPYWDKYPLIVLLDTTDSSSFLGLNLHYIKPKDRQNFLETILKYSSTKFFTKNTKFNINWNKVKNIKFSDKMIKRYLKSHIKSNLNVVPPTEWHNAVYLPTQQFMSNGKRFGARNVW